MRCLNMLPNKELQAQSAYAISWRNGSQTLSDQRLCQHAPAQLYLPGLPLYDASSPAARRANPGSAPISPEQRMCAGQVRDTPAARNPGELFGRLLPQPRSLRASDGFFHLTDRMVISHDGRLEPPELAAVRRLCDLCTAQTGVRPDVRVSTVGRPEGQIALSVAPDTQTCPESPDRQDAAARDLTGESAKARQGYRLRITPDRVEVVGRSSAGLFYALQTLQQLLLGHGRRWPGLEVSDVPVCRAHLRVHIRPRHRVRLLPADGPRDP